MKPLSLTPFFLMIFLTASIFSQNTYDAVRITDHQIGFGARSIGMGGAYQAIADDYSAVYWNPAGLAQIRRMEFWLGISHNRFSNDIIYQEVASEASNTTTKFNSIGFVFPVPTYRGSLVFALGYQKFKDFDYINKFTGLSSQGPAEGSSRLSFSGVDPNNPEEVYDFFGEPVQKTGFVTDEGSLEEWSAAGAVDVSPNISLGASLIFNNGSSDYYDEFTQLDNQYNFQIYPGDFNEYYEERIISSKYSSFKMRLGSLFHFSRFIRVGLGMEIPQKINVKEDYLLDSNLLFDDGFEETFDESDQDNTGTYEYDVTVPFRFSGGLALQLRNILLSGGIEYIDWTQLEFDSGELTSLNRYFDSDYRETFKLRVGGELSIPLIASQFRAGLIYDPCPEKNLSEDYDRKYVSVGYGILVDRIFQLDLAYLVGFWKQTTYGELSPEGTAEDITYQNIMINISFRY